MEPEPEASAKEVWIYVIPNKENHCIASLAMCLKPAVLKQTSIQICTFLIYPPVDRLIYKKAPLFYKVIIPVEQNNPNQPSNL